MMPGLWEMIGSGFRKVFWFTIVERYSFHSQVVLSLWSVAGQTRYFPSREKPECSEDQLVSTHLIFVRRTGRQFGSV